MNDRMSILALVVIIAGFILGGCDLELPGSAPTATAEIPRPTQTPSSTTSPSNLPSSTPTVIPSRDATATNTATPMPSPTVTPTSMPRLTLDVLRNTAYPSEWPKNKVARLSNGVYVEEYVPGAATKMVISLADMHIFGDLDGDGIDDALVIVVSRPGGSGTFFYLSAVLNQNGTPNPVDTALLGDRVIIRSIAVESGQIVIKMITHGPNDPMCCPNQDTRQVYTLEDNKLKLVERIDHARTEPAVPLDVKPERIEFAPNATSVTIQGGIFPIGWKKYVLHGQEGQVVALTVTSPYDHVLLSSYGTDDNVPLVSIKSEVISWKGELPSTQDYAINLASIAGSETSYTLRVDVERPIPPIPKPAVTPVPPKPTPKPTAEVVKMIYLTFDDGPTDPRWTPQVLEVLSRYNAKATFFVLGQLAQRFPDLIQAELDAGHAVGNHTFDHRTLDAIGRQGFLDEILRTQQVLGRRGAKCMRPPYGATDGYTLAYASELGYRIIMWDIDTQDWQQPGASAIESEVLSKAHPGAVVLMHDGGGDRSQTIEALDKVLKELSQRGYTFGIVCR